MIVNKYLLINNNYAMLFLFAYGSESNQRSYKTSSCIEYEIKSGGISTGEPNLGYFNGKAEKKTSTEGDK